MKREIFLNRIEGCDIASAFRKSLSELSRGAAIVFRLDPGTYVLTESRCPRKFCAISNHDSAERAVAFDLSGASEVEFDGGGALLQCVGRIIPFFMEGARRITLRNFTIDWKRPFFSEGEILEVGPEGEVRLLFDRKKYPLTVAEGRMKFLGEEYESTYLDNAIEIDAARGEIALHAKDSWGIRDEHRAVENNDGSITLWAPFGNGPDVGNILALPHELRTSPAMVCSRSQDVVVEDVTLCQAGGMGLIAQMCRDIRVSRMIVRPGARGSYTSLNADVTHFVECDGDILLRDCNFSGQMDDAANVHGVYLRVKKVLGTHELIVEAANFQQEWVDYFLAGEKISIVNPADFTPVAIHCLTEVVRQNAREIVFRTAEHLGNDLVGKMVTTGERRVSCLVEGGNFHHYRTDGLLLSAPGKHRVRRNRFAVPGQGVLVTCDCSNWFESGPVEDLVIEENEFDHCAYGQRPYPCAIRIAPNDPEKADAATPVHRNIVIRKNRFRGRRPFISHYRVENLQIEDNNLFLDEEDCDVASGLVQLDTEGHSG